MNSSTPENSVPPSPQTPPQPPLQKRTRHTLWAIGAAMLLGASAFGLLRSEQKATQNPTSSLSPIVDETKRDNGSTSMQQMTPGAGASKSKPIALAVWLPNDEGQLVRKALGANLPPAPPMASKNAVARAQWMETAGEIALRTLMKETPESFPSGTQIKDVKWNKGTLEVDFNARFSDADFWQGSARTVAGTQALAWTVDGIRRALGTELSQDLPPLGVRLMVEGKALETLGELEVAEPLRAEDEATSKP